MELSKLEAFAVEARRELMRGVADKIVFALQEDSPVRRQNPHAVAELEKAIKVDGEDAVIERTAYVWFNRFCSAMLWFVAASSVASPDCARRKRSSAFSKSVSS